MNNGAPDNVKLHTVSELTNHVKTLLEDGFPSVWVTGEISNFAAPRSGHKYFSLKDANAQLRAALFRGVGNRLKFDLADGLEVLARGRITVYAPRGDYQLIVEEMQPKGVGALELAFRQLREKLLVKGWFDPSRKKPLPRLPQRIALVTSPTGAAVRDMLRILKRRWPTAEVWVCPTLVQGDGAAEQIASTIRQVNQIQPRPDVIIAGRGGGSLEDLWAFNEEIVAEAIHESTIPVISAVGHEVDVTIADLVADHRAATPSEAAELVAPDRGELLESLAATKDRLRELLIHRLNQCKHRWNDLLLRKVFRQPLDRIREGERRLDDWEQRLQRAIKQRLRLGQKQVEAVAGRLEGLSPLNVLSRGYSLTRNGQEVVRSSDQVQVGDELETLLHQGKVISRVERTEPSA